ncbi:MAG: hypothetical protein ACLUBL_07340 [Fusobacterium sp.]|uniref:hypothetical protein n=1 Tax=Fusobacterium sp. TaxID=68766 RepID=UPI00399660EE
MYELDSTLRAITILEELKKRKKIISWSVTDTEDVTYKFQCGDDILERETSCYKAPEIEEEIHKELQEYQEWIKEIA